eukprot:CAMPEP_0119569384 /NCGR_PEP_ID=MMETSP1352-20130426/41457_1 /TAXON_ID=265584 /ORGANISM="Stauroneis constricta, Strain CCMP1120" /LENGTH=77 /DNA_ID=CAMNT_0007618925 /DNA_START=112 /DNA_END=341 /DNA_ORIENTATION=+
MVASTHANGKDDAALHATSTANTSRNQEVKKKDHPMLQFIAGGVAGMTESSICHPLDTIKTRMQLSSKTKPAVTVAA